MVQLNEIYEGEIISLKKGKNGIVTIKIQTNYKQGDKKNGFINFFTRHHTKQPGHNRGNVPGRIPGNTFTEETSTEDSRREESGTRTENSESRSESGKEIPSSESGNR